MNKNVLLRARGDASVIPAHLEDERHNVLLSETYEYGFGFSTEFRY